MNTLTWLITLLLVALPHLGMHLLARYKLATKPGKWPSPILIIAGAIYPIARFLPEPAITEESITLAQHFVGGGFISALYFIYAETHISLPKQLLIRFGLLYATVSAFGAANEILEFTATKIGLYQLDGSDVWWDLASNTLGAFTLYAILLICKKLVKR